jgi:hypothetical protein
VKCRLAPSRKLADLNIHSDKVLSLCKKESYPSSNSQPKGNDTPAVCLSKRHYILQHTVDIYVKAMGSLCYFTSEKEIPHLVLIKELSNIKHLIACLWSHPSWTVREIECRSKRSNFELPLPAGLIRGSFGYLSTVHLKQRCSINYRPSGIVKVVLYSSSQQETTWLLSWFLLKFWGYNDAPRLSNCKHDGAPNCKSRQAANARYWMIFLCSTTSENGNMQSI